MIVSHPWLLVFCITALLLVLGATSGLVNSRLWMSEPLACAVAGVLLGPLALDLIALDPGHDPEARAFLREGRGSRWRSQCSAPRFVCPKAGCGRTGAD